MPAPDWSPDRRKIRKNKTLQRVFPLFRIFSDVRDQRNRTGMKKSKQKSSRGMRRPSPVIIIGGSVVLLAVAFFFISRVIIDNRDPEASRVLAERSGKAGTSEGDDASAAAHAMRDDAVLSFLAPDGAARTTVRIEIAEDEVSRTQGLMGRQHMAEDQGMLFIFPDEQYRSFWMANTPLALDIIYLNSAREIVTIQRNTVPFSEESVPSTRPATYVVEVNAGFADRHGLAEGDKVLWLRK
jgi:uncharacterized protein